MKKINILLVALLLVSFILPVFAYKNGDKIELPTATIDAGGTIFKFSLPRGDYPKDSKVVIYAQKDVLCPFPGYTPSKPTDDKNPNTLLGEYKLSEKDIADLKAGETQFSIASKFDPECGAITAKLIASEEKPKDNEAGTDRPSGESDDDKLVLDIYSEGMQVPATFEVVGTLMFINMPQGSFTLADYLIVLDENKTVVMSMIITEEIMKALANGATELKHAVSGDLILDASKLALFVSDTSYTPGEILDVELDPNKKPDVEDNDNPAGSGSLNPIFVGVGVFALVVAVGLAAGYLEKLKKEKANKTNKE